MFGARVRMALTALGQTWSTHGCQAINCFSSSSSSSSQSSDKDGVRKQRPFSPASSADMDTEDKDFFSFDTVMSTLDEDLKKPKGRNADLFGHLSPEETDLWTSLGAGSGATITASSNSKGSDFTLDSMGHADSYDPLNAVLEDDILSQASVPVETYDDSAFAFVDEIGLAGGKGRKEGNGRSSDVSDPLNVDGITFASLEDLEGLDLIPSFETNEGEIDEQDSGALPEFIHNFLSDFVSLMEHGQIKEAESVVETLASSYPRKKWGVPLHDLCSSHDYKLTPSMIRCVIEGLIHQDHLGLMAKFFAKWDVS